MTALDPEALVRAALEAAAEFVSQNSLTWRFSSPWHGKDFAKEIRSINPAAIVARVNEMETCGKCMGSGYGGHPDSGAICADCDGSGGVARVKEKQNDQR